MSQHKIKKSKWCLDVRNKVQSLQRRWDPFLPLALGREDISWSQDPGRQTERVNEGNSEGYSESSREDGTPALPTSGQSYTLLLLRATPGNNGSVRTHWAFPHELITFNKGIQKEIDLLPYLFQRVLRLALSWAAFIHTHIHTPSTDLRLSQQLQ